jgi:hypothetical protein
MHDEQNDMNNLVVRTNLQMALATLVALMFALPANAQTREQSKRIYDRLAGVPPTEQEPRVPPT